MSSSGSPGGFSLHDLLTRIIPGSVFLAPFLAMVYLEVGYYPSNGISIIIFALIAYITGELIETIRSAVFRVPLPFILYVYNITGKREDLPIWYKVVENIDDRIIKVVPQSLINLVPDFLIDRNTPPLDERLQFNFGAEMEERLNLNYETAKPRDIYDTLVLYLGEEISPRTQRQQVVYIFNRNLIIAAFSAVLLQAMAVFATRLGIIPLITFSTALIVFVIVVGMSQIFAITPQLYVELLAKEFYIKEGIEDRMAD